jgi:hypothetical protein
MKLSPQTIRVFKCIQKCYYELRRLQFDATLNETAAMHKIFCSGGFEFLNTERKRIISKTHIDGNLDPTDPIAIIDTPARTKHLRSKLNARLLNASFGYRHEKQGKVRIEQAEAEIVRIIFASFVSSGSIAKVREVLDFMGLEGFDWGRVYKILNNGFYVGRVVVDGYRLNSGNAVPPIVENAIYLRTQDILRGQQDCKKPGTYLLSRFVTRNETTRYFCGYVVRKKTGLNLYYYGCNRNAKGHFTIRADKFENLFQEYLMSKIETINRCTSDDCFSVVHKFVKPTIIKFKNLVNSKIETGENQNKNDLRELGKILTYFKKEKNYDTFGKELINNCRTLWLNSDQELRREIQFTLFPYGVKFDCATSNFEDVVNLSSGHDTINIGFQNPNFSY